MVPVSPFVVAQGTVRDLAVVRAQADLGQPNLLSKDDLAYLWQMAPGSLFAPAPIMHSEDAQTMDFVDVAGLDAENASDVVAQVRGTSQV